MNLKDNTIAQQLQSIPNDGEEETSVTETEDVTADTSNYTNQLNEIEIDNAEETSTNTISAVGTSNIPEQHEVKEEVEKVVPPSQDTLYTQYSKKYPQLFDMYVSGYRCLLTKI